MGFGRREKQRGMPKGSWSNQKTISKGCQVAFPRFRARIISNGIDLERFKPINRDICRKQLGWQLNCFHELFPTTNGNPCKRVDLAKAAVNVVNALGLHTEMHQLTRESPTATCPSGSMSAVWCSLFPYMKGPRTSLRRPSPVTCRLFLLMWETYRRESRGLRGVISRWQSRTIWLTN